MHPFGKFSKLSHLIVVRALYHIEEI